MLEIIKKNITLVLGLSIPVVMIALVAISVYIPKLLIHPSVDFLYVMGGYDGESTQMYSVQDGKLIISPIEPALKAPTNQPRIAGELYIYSAIGDKSKHISFEEAQKLNLDSENISLDGFEVLRGNNGGGFPFFYSDNNYNTFYFKGHGGSKKLNIQTSGSYYNNFRFLGWIK